MYLRDQAGYDGLDLYGFFGGRGGLLVKINDLVRCIGNIENVVIDV